MTNSLLKKYRKLKETYTHKQIKSLYSVFVWEYIMNDDEIPSLKDFILASDRLDIVDVAEYCEQYGRDTYITILYKYYM